MLNSDLRDFYEKIYGNSETKNKFIEKLNLATSEENLKEVLETEIIPFTKSLGFEFTCEQFLSYIDEQRSMLDDGLLLDDEFLENVVGGVGGFQKFAATVSLAIVGLGVLAPAVSASAAAATNATAAPQTQIEWSIANEMRDSHEEKNVDESNTQEDSNVESESQRSGGAGVSASANLIFDENQLDLLEGNNLNKALQGAVSALLNLTAEDNEGGKYDYFKEVLSNAEVINALVNINGCLENDSLSDTEKQLKLISHLKTVKTTLERANLADNLLHAFADSMGNEYKVILSRQVADEVIEKNRAAIEKKMGSESASFSTSASTNVNVDGVEVGVGFGVNLKENSSETSFYQTSTGFSIDLSAGLGAIGIAEFDVETKVEVTRALVYQSLEQFLDTSFSEGKVSSLRLRVPSINEVAETRDKMQKHEQKAISTLKTSAEPMLKLLGVISQKTNLVLPDLTKTRSATRETTVKSSVGVEAQLKADTGVLKVLSDAGIKVSGEIEASKGMTSTSVRHSFMELINDTCSPGFGTTSNELASFLKADNFNKFTEIKDLLKEGTSEAAVVSIAKTITHDLHDYNHCLSVMANENASKEDKSNAEAKKHDMEKNWLSTFHTGRLNMLKAGISIATTLKEQEGLTDRDDTQKVFKDLHTELDNLSKMQSSTNSLRSAKKSAEFSTTHTSTSKEYGFSGKISLSIPGAEEASVNISEESVKSQFDEHSKHDLTIDVKLPVVGNNIVGENILQHTMAKVQDKLIKSGHEDAADLADGIELMNKQLALASNSAGYALNNASSAVGVTSYVTLTFCFAKLNANNGDSALPGQQLMEKAGHSWALKYTKSTESNKVGVTADVDAVKVKATGTVNRATSKIGSDSLEFSVNKFNVFAQSMNDSNHKKDISNLWIGFKNGQKDQFKKIFKNITQSDSDARYELQGFYNEILEESGNSKSIRKTVDNAFKDFLEACDDFASDSSDKNFEKASAAFDKVLKLNFEHNYMAGFNELHGTLK